MERRYYFGEKCTDEKQQYNWLCNVKMSVYSEKKKVKNNPVALIIKS